VLHEVELELVGGEQLQPVDPELRGRAVDKEAWYKTV